MEEQRIEVAGSMNCHCLNCLFSTVCGKCVGMCWKCVCSKREQEGVYLLTLENSMPTEHFEKYFRDKFRKKFKIQSVSCSEECTEDYAIVLLMVVQTDRSDENIGSVMTKIHEERLYSSIALINLHVVTDKKFLPKVPTSDKIGKDYNLGIILDFGVIQHGIVPCQYDGKKKPEKAIKKFVLNRQKKDVSIELSQEKIHEKTYFSDKEMNSEGKIKRLILRQEKFKNDMVINA